MRFGGGYGKHSGKRSYKRSCKRFGQLAAWTAALLLLSGCWDYQDLESRAPILGMGFDLSGDPRQPIRASAEVPVAAAVAMASGGPGASGERPPKEVFESEGVTISEAVDMLSEMISRDLINRHVEAVVVSRDLAVQGLGPLVDYFMRNPQVNLRAQLWVTSGTAREVLSVNPASNLLRPSPSRRPCKSPACSP